jgi:hypothetical protein
MSRPGQEIEGPMAVTVLGGLLTSTLLNLIVLPALAQRYITRHAPPTARPAQTAPQAQATGGFRPPWHSA